MLTISPILTGMTGLDWWTKLISPGNLVHMTATTEKDYKLVPLWVHDCQIEYKLMSLYNNSQSVTNTCILNLYLSVQYTFKLVFPSTVIYKG